MSTPETELKSAEASLAATKAVIEGDALKVETTAKSLWTRYEIYLISAAVSILTLIVAHKLHL
jgi:hypothetical protein